MKEVEMTDSDDHWQEFINRNSNESRSSSH